MGLIVSLTGPSFSGKTYFVLQLLKDFPDFKVVNFEKHYNKKDIALSYKTFIEDVLRLHNEGHNVICESVYSPENNPFYTHQFPGIVNVVSLPSLTKHKENFRGFLRLFGWKIAKERLGVGNLEQMRENYLKKGRPLLYLQYDGKNYNTIKQRICEYVGRCDNNQ